MQFIRIYPYIMKSDDLVPRNVYEFFAIKKEIFFLQEISIAKDDKKARLSEQNIFASFLVPTSSYIIIM